MTTNYNKNPSVSVSSTIHSDGFLQKAASLAAHLDLSFIADISSCETELILCYTEEGLKLLELIPAKRRLRTALFVDFVHGKHGYRLHHNHTTKQPLARAIGIRPGIRPKILDGTAGLGGDSFVMASLGCRVTLCERHPIIAALLEDGLKRAEDNPRTAAIATNRMHCLAVDTMEFLASTDERFDTIYLDPMYPHRESSALGKKSMRLVRDLVGDDTDSSQYLQVAKRCKPSRVVVKRPRSAPLISTTKPDHVIAMKSSRYDIYFL